MSQSKDYIDKVNHINDEVNYLITKSKKLTYLEFLKDETLKRAFVRSLEIIGEAVKNVSTIFREKYTEIPWKKISGMRDKIIHGYFNVDIDIVWKVIVKDIPILKKNIEEIIKKEE